MPEQRSPDLELLDPLFAGTRKVQGLRNQLLETAHGPRLSLRNRLYYRLRPLIPLPVRHLLQRLTRPRSQPEQWYINDSLLRLYAQDLREPAEISPLWPDGHEGAVVLTHDVESAEGYQAIEPVLQLEEKYGFRSEWNFVADLYPLDNGFLKELQSRSFGVGVHGYNHDGRLYLSKRNFNRRAVKINQRLQEWHVHGFRSPQVHRQFQWMQQLNIDFDASTFDVDPFQPMPGGNGSLWPFRIGRFLEIPYTLPQDHVLFITNQETSDRIWREKTLWLRKYQGMICLITHPDYLVDQTVFKAYESFLNWLSSQDNLWRTVPVELTRWWSERERSLTDPGSDTPPRLRIKRDESDFLRFERVINDET